MVFFSQTKVRIGNIYIESKLSRNIYNSDYFTYNYYRTPVRHIPNTTVWGGHSMEINASEIRHDIHEIIDRITDFETLDFIHKLLVSECG